MTKDLIRKEKTTWRKALSTEEINLKSTQILQLVRTYFSFQETQNIHLFFSIPNRNEINTWLLWDFLKTIISPTQCYTSIVDTTTQTLRHVQLSENVSWEYDSFNIPIPKEKQFVDSPKLDIIFVPLLAFNEKNHRIGYGKGHYDRFLSAYSKKTICIGLAFDGLRADFEAEKHDIPLSYIVTEKAIQYIP